MEQHLKVLFVDVSNGFYKIKKYKLGEFFGPVDLGLHLSGKYNTLNIGTGLLAGSIFPGSNRLIFTGFSPAWGGFYVSSMGGAGLVFDNLGINTLAITGQTHHPSVLYLNRNHQEEVEIQVIPIDVEEIWKSGKQGVYSLMQEVLQRHGKEYQHDPRILAVGPAAKYTDMGGICSAPISQGVISNVDTWAGRGGLGSKLYQHHGIVSVIYGGTWLEEDFRDRKVADSWFAEKYNKTMIFKDFEATTKYRFDPKFDTGGTFGVNYHSNSEALLAFNYKSISWTKAERKDFHQKYIAEHYLKQYNQEIIAPKKFYNCGEPCVAVCKKVDGEFKKDYEPYQTMGPLSGIFDQRAAEKLNHTADTLGFDAISVGGVISWLFDCMQEKLLTPEELGLSGLPKFDPHDFRAVEDSALNADLGCQILQNMLGKEAKIPMQEGARKYARHLGRVKGKQVIDKFLYNAFGRKGWMVPNQYWVPGVLSPMPITGKYYMYYGPDYFPPRFLGRMNAERMIDELMLDNLGICRFHRGWAEEMVPEIIAQIYNQKDAYLQKLKITASRINSRNASVYWESKMCIEFVHTYLKRQHDELGNNEEDLLFWLNKFNTDPEKAAEDYWYEIRKGIDLALREFA